MALTSDKGEYQGDLLVETTVRVIASHSQEVVLATQRKEVVPGTYAIWSDDAHDALMQRVEFEMTEAVSALRGDAFKLHRQALEKRRGPAGVRR